MEIPTVVNTYLILLLVGVVSSFLIGYGFTKKYKDHKVGFYTTSIVSLIILILLAQWFKSTPVELLYRGTIKVLFNLQAITIILYPIYLTITWFVLKRSNKEKLLS